MVFGVYEMTNRESTLIVILIVLLCVSEIVESIKKDSQIQKLQAQVDSIPDICMEQFGGGK